eukprot:TRINITY_DN56354_c0_g1_i1.p1 TRINITY_DN56354_c0_g1~~TRINITY_DN56354_c0_g1_i1.p1  ORF type:complete len:262 (+),score=26.16 TRINITY_DN56354_c0_g1_i1:31-786(+)
MTESRGVDRLMIATSGIDPNAQGPFDCHGSGCEATGEYCGDECEGRHLDRVELSRFETDSGFHYPRKPCLVIAASKDMGRTASTWVFNAVRLLFRQAREACDSYWIRGLTKEKLHHRQSTGAHVLVKTHEWFGTAADFQEMVPLFTHVVVSVRKGFEPDPHWMKFATHVMQFEEIVAYDDSTGTIGALSVLRSLAEHLGITSLSDDDIRIVDYELMTLPIPRGNDPVTKMWSFHKRRGGRPVPPRPIPSDP